MHRGIDDRLTELRPLEQSYRRDLDGLRDSAGLDALIGELLQNRRWQASRERAEIDAAFEMLLGGAPPMQIAQVSKRRKASQRG